MKNLLEYVGIEPGRLHFSWISSAEAEKFQKTVMAVTDAVKALGPANQMIKQISPEGAAEPDDEQEVA